MTTNQKLRETLNLLQSHIGEGNASRGFHEEGDALRVSAENALPPLARDEWEDPSEGEDD